LEAKGQIFTIDAMLAILIVTVLIGVSADAMDIADNKITEYSSEHSIERIAECAADILIKTPGSPDKWEELNDYDKVTPGLAVAENDTGKVVENTLNMRKVMCLKENPDLMNKILPPHMNSRLMIYPSDTYFPIIAVHNNSPQGNTADVYLVNRTVLYDNMFMKSVIRIKPGISRDVTSEYEYICTHSNSENQHKRPDFMNKKGGWLCNPFNINSNDIILNDYYMLTDPPVLSDNSAKWIIDKPDNISENFQKFITKPIKLNSRFSELLGDHKNATITLHVYMGGDQEKSFNTYIVSVPRGTSLEYIRLDYMNPMPAFLVLKVWV
jgi:hypothetical protein